MAAQFAGQTQASQGAAMIAAQEQQAAMAAQAGIAGQMAGQGLERELGYEQLVSAGELGQMDAQVQSQLGNRELNLKAKQDRHGRIQDWIGAGGKVVGSIPGAIFSDERVKRNVAPGGMAATQAVGSADPITFDYQPGFGPHGRQVGVTAQSLDTSRSRPSASPSTGRPRSGPRWPA